MMSETVKVRTRYVGPTDTTGSKIVVKVNGRQRSVPYDYAANDVHLSAAITALTDLNIWQAGDVLHPTADLPRGYEFTLTREDD